METFPSYDGTQLAFHRVGAGSPLICLPGGAMRASAYLGTLGGLAADHELLLLDLRGTGSSSAPSDPDTYRADRQAADVEALRVHLGLDGIALAGHSAGAAVATHYAAAHPDRLTHLVLINPSPRVVGLEISDADRQQVMEQRRDEPWFPEAFAALQRLWAGEATEADWDAIAPFNYGTWDADARADVALPRNVEAGAVYYAADPLDASALAAVKAPVLLITGEYDPQIPPHRAPDYAALFPNATVAVAAGAAHSTFVDDPAWFRATVADFLRSR
ncbi:alpha/beta fold hydrolase [Paractinoplanes durhamensis]|uniref:Hydrolase n=1 Tax=Paractinoplanes durhamensis TaxID=113563 RepID=A0ABQ3ZBV8_9ACTN|nr:alpha/beta hydrolase [Actinoplanes durhamensis]GIE07328.1 hydrolase [Actinoplanes durhamensis]